MSEEEPHIRKCKQCGEVMAVPLEVAGKLFMFCCAECRRIWDHERAYRSQPQRKRSWDD